MKLIRTDLQKDDLTWFWTLFILERELLRLIYIDGFMYGVSIRRWFSIRWVCDKTHPFKIYRLFIFNIQFIP